MQRNQPLKRSASLTPLSHEHHHGLVVCRRVQEGLKLGIPADRISAYVRDFWERDLQRHFEEEESVIFSLPGTDGRLVQQAVDEHAQIRRYLAQLSEPGADEAALLAQWAGLLQSHIRFEERTLFPHIEQHVAADLLLDAGQRLQRDHSVSCVTWADEFWLR